MDIKILDGDNVMRGGRFESVCGFDETAQQAIISIVGKRGCFIYDRELGSDLQEYINSVENINLKQINSIISSAVSRIGNVSAKAKSFVKSDSGCKITVEIQEKDSGAQEERVIVI